MCRTASVVRVIGSLAASIVCLPAIAADNHVLRLSNVGNYMTAPHSGSLAASSELTVEYWLLFENTTGFGRMGKNAPSDCQWGFGPAVGTNMSTFDLCGPANDVNGANGFTVPQNRWVHLAATWKQSTGTSRVYIDGQLVRSVTGSTAPMQATDYPLVVGMQPGYENSQLFGSIDNLRIWNIERSAQQIEEARYVEIGAAQASNYPGLAASYTFENAATDATGANNATLMGGAAIAIDNTVPSGPPVLLVPSQYATIQSAISAVPPGVHRVVQVAAGTYTGPIDFGGRDIAIIGAGPDVCVISGTGGAASSVVLGTAEPATSVLEGFTIRDGMTGSPLPSIPTAMCGGGVLLVESALRVRNCRFIANQATFGGGAYLWHSAARFENCLFLNNLAQSRAGGADVYECVATFVGCEFRSNQAAIGGGLQAYLGQPTLENCLIQSNIAFDVGGGIHWYPTSKGGLLTLRNCTIQSNSAPVSSGLSMYAGTVASRTMLFGTTVCGNLPRNVVGRYQADAATTVCDCPADVVFDGVVNGADLALVLGNWGVASDPLQPSDANGDGLVDGTDLAIVLGSWGSCAGQ